MAYNEIARARRHCLARTKSGYPCSNYALWNSKAQLCASHTHLHRNWHPNWRRNKPPPCTCGAYQWPHRLNSGRCCYPDRSFSPCPTPAQSHAFPRLQGGTRALARELQRRDPATYRPFWWKPQRSTDEEAGNNFSIEILHHYPPPADDAPVIEFEHTGNQNPEVV